jgi:hypothetical protein
MNKFGIALDVTLEGILDRTWSCVSTQAPRDLCKNQYLLQIDGLWFYRVTKGNVKCALM